jgi:serine protease
MFEPVAYNSTIALNAEINKPGTGTRPNDPMYDQQWNFKMVGAEEAWKKTKGKGVIVAVIDTGVAAESTKKGKQCKDFNTTSFVKGYDFVNKDADPFDDHGHGTHVAGTIAESTNNSEGVAGLAYESTIMPLKVLSAGGSGSSSDIADAIRYAADNGAHVINMSLGSNQPSSVIQKACQYAVKKGVVIVCAAGNGFGEPVGYPAAFPECIAISSVGPSGKIATYSSYGKQVALAAPGGDMMESGNARDGILQNTVMTGKGDRAKGDDYYAFQGTSMASPHAAAVAALVVSQGINDPARVRDILTKSATPNGEPNKYGAGILSASNAVSMANAVEGVKLRHILLFGGAFLLMAIGPRRSFWTRAGMVGALGVGFFGADAAANLFGANSPWNLLTFSAALPAVAYFGTRKSVGGAKVSGAFALGVAMNLWAGWHNDLHPFTTYSFGDAAHPWALANMGAAFVIANLAGWKAVKLSGGTDIAAK